MRCYFSTVSLRSHFKAHMSTRLRTDLRGRCRVFERIQPAALFVLLRPVGPPRACWCLLLVSDAMWHCAAERQSGERGGGHSPTWDSNAPCRRPETPRTREEKMPPEGRGHGLCMCRHHRRGAQPFLSVFFFFFQPCTL